VNLAGPEFGMEEPGYSSFQPGRDGEAYRFPAPETVAAASRLGFGVLRLPLSWERLQPVPGGPLDREYTARTLETLDAAGRAGAGVVLDLHAYGRFRLGSEAGVRTLVLGAPDDGPAPDLLPAHLADLWLRLLERTGDHPALLACGLMNEPHDMGAADWHTASREVVHTLRAAGHRQWLWVAGDGWSKAQEWHRHNPRAPWIDDPLGRTAYEAHVYFDADGSGRYALSFDEELQADPSTARRGIERVRPFAEWCERGGVPGVIGEFGLPWWDPAWRGVQADLLRTTRERGLVACAWAAGEWWGDYPLSLQPALEGVPLPGPLAESLAAGASTR
jgi:endoglucanase